MRRQRGFTLLELIVVVCIVAVLAGSLLSRIIWYQKQAEEAHRETVVGVIRSALGMKVAELVVQGRSSEISNLITLNPMDLLAQKPANYLGELNPTESGNISGGNWYFNRKLFLLVYSAESSATFQVALPRQFIYKIELIRDLDGVIGPDNAKASTNRIQGVDLKRLADSAQ